MAEPPLRSRRVVKSKDPRRLRSGWDSWPLLTIAGVLLLAGPLLVASHERAATLHASAFMALGLISSLLGLYRPLGGPGLGLAAVLVVPLLMTHGSVLGAWVAVLAALGTELLRRFFASRGTDPAPERRRPVRLASDALRVGCAVLLAGLVYHRVPETVTSYTTWEWVRESLMGRPMLASLATYLLVLFALEFGERVLYGRAPADLVSSLPPFALEAAGWLVGGSAGFLISSAGWWLAMPLLILLSALSTQLARSHYRHADLERKIRTLRNVGGAGERVLPSGHEGRQLAQQIAKEIAQTLDYSWFQLELNEPDGTAMSFRADADGTVEPGTPMPAPSPPALPGIHRRRQWTFIDRELNLDDQPVGRLRLWCDPRRVDSEALETLELLLPQLAVSAEHARLDREAHTDSLTGIAVRRVLTEGLNRALEECRNEGTSAGVILCDIDHFKQVNDTWGHGVGDQALQAVAEALRSKLRATDICCRYGGEEFALLLDGVSSEQALETAERLRRRVEALHLDIEGRPVLLTISAGVAVFPQVVAADGAELLQLADLALYAAKESGRNRVLLTLGRGRFLTPEGVTLGEAPPLEAPRL